LDPAGGQATRHRGIEPGLIRGAEREQAFFGKAGKAGVVTQIRCSDDWRAELCHNLTAVCHKDNVPAPDQPDIGAQAVLEIAQTHFPHTERNVAS